MTLARQWRGQQPFEEAWFVEALIAPDEGLWLRWVIDATAGRAELWAIVLGRDGVIAAERESVPLSELTGDLFAIGAGRLERDFTVGRCGAVSWELRLDDRGIRHTHVPLWVRLAGLGKTYDPVALDLRVRGTVTVGGRALRVDAGPAVFGHLWGAGSRLRRWAWAHCNAFDREDLIFEGLCAELPAPGVGAVGLTSLVLHADGHAYTFSRTRDLIRTWSRFGERTWSFEARAGDRVLTGRIDLDPSRAARVRYPGHGRADLTCTNTRFGVIRLVLRDPRHGVDLDLRSRECAFEIAGPADGGRHHLG